MDARASLLPDRTALRGRVAYVIVGLTVWLTVSAGMTSPADAAVNNLQSANQAEETTDTFRADDALFLVATVDTKGGRVCVVSAVGDLSGLSCDRNAWGSPNTVAPGAGTVIQPIEAPFLRIGTWRLFSETIPANEGTEDPEPIAVSEPFHVAPCGDTCDKTIATDIVNEFKATNLARWEIYYNACATMVLVSTFKSLQSDFNDAISGKLLLDELKERLKLDRQYKWDFGSGALVVSPFGGVSVSFVPAIQIVRTGEKKAIEILKQLTCTLGAAYADLANDPPDPDYALVEEPTQRPVVPLGNSATDAFAESTDRELGLGLALLTAFERYQAAQAAGDQGAVHRQAAALARFGFGIVAQSQSTVTALREYAAVLDTLPEFADPLAADAGEVAAIQALHDRITSQGFTAEELQNLRSIGLTEEEIGNVRGQFDVNFTGLMPGKTYQDGLAIAADRLQGKVPRDPLADKLAGIDRFARAAEAVASATDVPPEPSFTAAMASPSTPLVMRFVDESASPDLDPIESVSWDFGDGATAEGAVVDHTYSQAGTFNVTLQVCDLFGCANLTRAIAVGLPTADLSITKTDSPDPVTVSEELTYTLTARNAGPDEAVATTISDSLPADVTYVSANPSQGTCSESAGTVSCDLGTLAASGEASVTLKVTPTAANPTLTNTARVSSQTADPDGGNDEARAQTEVKPALNRSPVAQDDTLTTRVDTVGTVDVLANDSDPDFTDTLTVTSSTEGASGTVACSTSGSCTYTPTQGFTGTDSFTYTVSDGRGGTATATVQVTVQIQTLREITAANPQFCLPFNVGLAFDGTNLLVSCVGTNVIDKINPSDGGLMGQVTVAGESVLGALSYDRKRGKLWACTFGGAERVMLIDPVDGSKDAEFASNGCGDGLAYDGSDDTLWAGPDQDCTVTHYETNGTVIGAFNVCPLIGGLGKSGIAVGGGKLYIANPAAGQVYEVEKDFSASSLLFDTDRFLEDLECDDVTFAPKTAMWVQAAYDRTLTAVEIPAGACPFGGDPPLADLSITKTDSPDPVSIGDEITYTLTARNAGPDAASAVAISDSLPPGVDFVSANPSQGSCSQSAGTVSCDLGTLAASGEATVTITVRPTAATPVLTNTARVSSQATDPNASDNEASVQTEVNPPPPRADLSITKTDSPDPVTVGDELTYSLTIRNAGPDEATTVTATDSLPSDVAYLAANPSQGSCSGSAGTVRCELGTLAASGEATVTIRVKTRRAATLTNSASVLSEKADPDPANNQATAETEVSPPPGQADLSIAKSDSPDPLTVGEELAYTLTVRNAGPDEAILVNVVDSLPAPVRLLSATPSQGSCTDNSVYPFVTVTCELGTLAAGGEATVSIKARTTLTGTVTNSASVSSATADPEGANNLDSEDTLVEAPVPPLPGTCLTYGDFSPPTGLNLLGSPQVAGDVLRLTPADFYQVAQAWFASKVDVAGGFATEFRFRFTDPGGVVGDEDGAAADGITFAIQNAGAIPGGSAGGSLGYVGISNSLVVELDSFNNGPGLGDADGNHVAVHSRGTEPNGPGPEGDSLLGAAQLTPLLQDGAVHLVRIVYDPVGGLSIYFDNLTTPVLTVAVDLDSTLTLDNGKAYVGFTSATGLAFENHDLIDWEFCPGQGGGPPTAVNQTVTTDEDTAKEVTLEASDPDAGDSLTYSIVSAPTHGTLGPVSGNRVTYTPAANYNGPDSFTFKANDGNADSNVATVAITVSPVNDPPVLTLSRGAVSAQYSDPIESVLARAVDPDGDLESLAFTGTGLPAALGLSSPTVASGSASANVSGRLNVAAGTYPATIRVTDSAGASDSEPLIVTVERENATITRITPASLSADLIDRDVDRATFTAEIAEAEDANPSSTLPSGIGLANAKPVTLTLTPAGGGASRACVANNTAYVGSTGRAAASCDLLDVSVGAYQLGGVIGGGFFTGVGSGALNVALPTAVNQPPSCAGVTATPSRLWPPNHKFVLVRLGGATDPDKDPVSLVVSGVTQDEPVNGGGDGNTYPDAMLTSKGSEVLLRAERSGGGDGRIYRISYQASDGKGGTCSGKASVGVPHIRGKGSMARNSGQHYNSLASAPAVQQPGKAMK